MWRQLAGTIPLILTVWFSVAGLPQRSSGGGSAWNASSPRAMSRNASLCHAESRGRGAPRETAPELGRVALPPRTLAPVSSAVPVPRRRGRVLGRIAVAVAVAGVLGFSPTLYAWGASAGRTYTAASVPVRDVAVVFGAEVLPNKTPSAFLQARLDLAYELWRTGKVEGHPRLRRQRRRALQRAGCHAELPDRQGRARRQGRRGLRGLRHVRHVRTGRTHLRRHERHAGDAELPPSASGSRRAAPSVSTPWASATTRSSRLVPTCGATACCASCRRGSRWRTTSSHAASRSSATARRRSTPHSAAELFRGSPPPASRSGRRSGIMWPEGVRG